MCKEAQMSCKFGISVGLILGQIVRLVKKKWLIENTSAYLEKHFLSFLGFPTELDVAS